MDSQSPTFEYTEVPGFLYLPYPVCLVVTPHLSPSPSDLRGGGDVGRQRSLSSGGQTLAIPLTKTKTFFLGSGPKNFTL